MAWMQVRSLLQQSQNKEGLELHSLLSEIHVQVEAHKHTPMIFLGFCLHQWNLIKIPLVCVAVFASGPRQHSGERNGAWAAAHPRRDTDPVGRRDCQDHSDREGQRHTTGESSTASLKTVDRGDPSYHLFNKYCLRFSLGHYSKDNLVDFNTGLDIPNNLGLKLQIGRFFFFNWSCYAVGMPVLDGSQVVPISKHLFFFSPHNLKGFHYFKKADIFVNLASMRESQRLMWASHWHVFSIMGVLQMASRSCFYRAVLALLSWQTPSAPVVLTVWLLQYLLIYYTTPLLCLLQVQSLFYSLNLLQIQSG